MKKSTELTYIAASYLEIWQKPLSKVNVKMSKLVISHFTNNL